MSNNTNKVQTGRKTTRELSFFDRSYLYFIDTVNFLSNLMTVLLFVYSLYLFALALFNGDSENALRYVVIMAVLVFINNSVR